MEKVQWPIMGKLMQKQNKAMFAKTSQVMTHLKEKFGKSQN